MSARLAEHQQPPHFIVSTDASVNEGDNKSAGAAIMFLGLSHRHLPSDPSTDRRCGALACSYRAENVTIERALARLLAELPNRAPSFETSWVLLLTDSQSAARKLASGCLVFSSDLVSMRSWELLLRLADRGYRVTIQFVHSHCGVWWNEQVDALAGELNESLPNADDTPIWLTDIVRRYASHHPERKSGMIKLSADTPRAQSVCLATLRANEGPYIGKFLRRIGFLQNMACRWCLPGEHPEPPEREAAPEPEVAPENDEGHQPPPDDGGGDWGPSQPRPPPVPPHLRHASASRRPTACPHPDCKGLPPYSVVASARQHWIRKHGLPVHVSLHGPSRECAGDGTIRGTGRYARGKRAAAAAALSGIAVQRGRDGAHAITRQARAVAALNIDQPADSPPRSSSSSSSTHSDASSHAPALGPPAVSPPASSRADSPAPLDPGPALREALLARIADFEDAEKTETVNHVLFECNSDDIVYLRSQYLNVHIARFGRDILQLTKDKDAAMDIHVFIEKATLKLCPRLVPQWLPSNTWQASVYAREL